MRNFLRSKIWCKSLQLIWLQFVTFHSLNPNSSTDYEIETNILQTNKLPFLISYFYRSFGEHINLFLLASFCFALIDFYFRKSNDETEKKGRFANEPPVRRSSKRFLCNVWNKIACIFMHMLFPFRYFNYMDCVRWAHNSDEISLLYLFAVQANDKHFSPFSLWLFGERTRIATAVPTESMWLCDITVAAVCLFVWKRQMNRVTKWLHRFYNGFLAENLIAWRRKKKKKSEIKHTVRIRSVETTWSQLTCDSKQASKEKTTFSQVQTQVIISARTYAPAYSLWTERGSLHTYVICVLNYVNWLHAYWIYCVRNAHENEMLEMNHHIAIIKSWNFNKNQIQAHSITYYPSFDTLVQTILRIHFFSFIFTFNIF